MFTFTQWYNKELNKIHFQMLLKIIFVFRVLCKLFICFGCVVLILNSRNSLLGTKHLEKTKTTAL